MESPFRKTEQHYLPEERTFEVFFPRDREQDEDDVDPIAS